jgi:hypothetical protein
MLSLLPTHPLATVVAVEVFELRAEYGPVVEASVTVYAEEDLLGASGMEVVLHHEIQQLPIAVTYLIDELRERDAARDQTFAGLARFELPQAAVGVPDDNPWGDVPDPHCLLRHDGPFLARYEVVPLFALSLKPPAPHLMAACEVYVQSRAL